MTTNCWFRPSIGGLKNGLGVATARLANSIAQWFCTRFYRTTMMLSHLDALSSQMQVLELEDPATTRQSEIYLLGFRQTVFLEPLDFSLVVYSVTTIPHLWLSFHPC